MEQLSATRSWSQSVSRRLAVMKIILLIIALFAIAGRNVACMERVASGKPMPVEDASYFVSIKYRGRHKCSGALVTEECVLTAEHCVSNEDGEYLLGLSVVLATDLQNADAAGRNVSEVLLLSKISSDLPRDTSIAVLVLSEFVPSNVHAVPIPLPVDDVPDARSSDSSPSPTVTLIALQNTTTPCSDQPLTQIQVRIERCHLPKVFCGMPDVLTSGDEGAPLVDDGRVIGIALHRRSKICKRDIYADVHGHWVLIFGALYDIDLPNVEKRKRKPHPRIHV